MASGDLAVCLQPLGEHDPKLLVPISRGLAQVYGVKVQLLRERALPKVAWYPPHHRFRAARLLDYLRDEVLPQQPGCRSVLAITAVDISMSKGEHVDWGVLGLSYQGARVGVVSSFRMRRGVDAARFARRAVKVSLHEFGHVLGLPHRSEGPGCLMNDAGGAIATIDRASGALCPGERASAELLLGRKLPPRTALHWNAILRN